MIPREYLAMYAGANAIALAILGLAYWRPRWARWLWVAIFLWAAFVNARTALETPYVYLVYGALTPSELYRNFIEGWFTRHLQPMVLSIAAGQLAMALLLAGGQRARRIGELGAAIFLLAIAPLGVGSGFPFSLFAVASLIVMERRWPAGELAGIAPSAATGFIAEPDVRESHSIVVHAPAALVFETACHADLESVWLVRAIFGVRGVLMRDTRVPRQARRLVAEMLSLGWGVLHYEHDRTLVMGASAQPWKANVTFDPIPPEAFATFKEPDVVKIVWTLEAEPLRPALTRFSTETRVEATDDTARRRFAWYWRAFGIGIVIIRKLLVRQVKREAERRYAQEAVHMVKAA
jgi:hypothetical protein